MHGFLHCERERPLAHRTVPRPSRAIVPRTGQKFSQPGKLQVKTLRKQAQLYWPTLRHPRLRKSQNSSSFRRGPSVRLLEAANRSPIAPIIPFHPISHPKPALSKRVNVEVPFDTFAAQSTGTMPGHAPLCTLWPIGFSLSLQSYLVDRKSVELGLKWPLP